MQASSRSYARTAAPGVYYQEAFPPRIRADFWTGVPAFIGVASSPKQPDETQEEWHAREHAPIPLRLWAQYKDHVQSSAESYLPYAVRGFFENGGRLCYVVPMSAASVDELDKALNAISANNEIDLVCVPDLPLFSGDWSTLQQRVVDHCEAKGDRFAILDTPLNTPPETAGQLWAELDGANGAIYYPWLLVAGDKGKVPVPPCGHVAGVFARTDLARGVQKAPANEVLRGVLDLELQVSHLRQNSLNVQGINCIRFFPGRGVRVWGARTLNAQAAWTYVNIRRLFLTLVRWIEWNMSDVVFEPNNPSLWGRVERDVNTYLLRLFRDGALRGASPDEAFYVKCDAVTNALAADRNTIVTEIGLAPSAPFEFVVVRFAHSPSGVTISGPALPDQPIQGDINATNR